MLVASYPPPLLGEVTDQMSAQGFYDFFRSRLPAGIDSAKLQSVVNNIYAKYVPVKGSVAEFNSSSMEWDIKIIVGLGLPNAINYQKELTSAFNDLTAAGWKIVPVKLASALPPAKQTEEGVTQALTTPGPGKKAVNLDDLQTALDSISSLAPLITLAKQQVLAQKVVAASKQGQQFYVPVDQAKPNVWPWIVGALGVTILLGAIVYVYAMPSGEKP